MTYKTRCAGLGLGGGKTVIVGDPRTDKTPAQFQALGGFIDSLGGAYIAAEDVGTTTRTPSRCARARARSRACRSSRAAPATRPR